MDYSDVLRPGERGVVLLIGADTQQAKVTKGYIEGILEQSPPMHVGQYAQPLLSNSRAQHWHSMNQPTGPLRIRVRPMRPRSHRRRPAIGFRNARGTRRVMRPVE